MKLKLKRREKILLMISGGLVVLVGLYFLLIAGDPRTEDQLIADQNKYNTEIAKKKTSRPGKTMQNALTSGSGRPCPPNPWSHVHSMTVGSAIWRKTRSFSSSR